VRLIFTYYEIKTATYGERIGIGNEFRFTYDEQLFFVSQNYGRKEKRPIMLDRIPCTLEWDHFKIESMGSRILVTFLTVSEPVSLKRSCPLTDQQDSTLGSACSSFIFLKTTADRSS
jgi:hypothetical protein